MRPATPILPPILALGLVLLLASGSQAQLTRTDRDHYRDGPSGGLTVPRSTEPDYRSLNPRSRVLMRRRRDLRNGGPPDSRLTKACRNGEFRQVREHRYIAVLNDKVYGAGIGGGRMLYDPMRQAQEGIVYAFVGQGTTNCRVYQLGAPGAG